MQALSPRPVLNITVKTWLLRRCLDLSDNDVLRDLFQVRFDLRAG